MAVLYITEYADVLHAPGEVQVGMEPANTDQTVAIAGSSAASSAFKNNTKLVRLHTDAICSITFAATPTATTSNRRMAANQTEYFAVSNNSALKVAVISNT